MKKFKLFIIVNIFLLFNCFNGFAQDKFSLSLGVGIPDWINIGSQYRVTNNSQIALRVGSLFLFNYNFSSSVGYKIHLFGQSKFETVKPWYLYSGYSFAFSKAYSSGKLVSSGITYYDYGGEFNENLHSLMMKIGREINFSKSVALSIDLGLAYSILISDPSTIKVYEEYAEYQRKNNPNWGSNEDNNKGILPALNILLLYRL